MAPGRILPHGDPKPLCAMRKQHAPETGRTAETTIHDFTAQELAEDQLLQLKGGDGDEPPADPGIGGHEDIVDL